MAHPKRRASKTRKNKRRTHDKLQLKHLSIDATTGEVHRRHTAHVSEGNLYYRGKLIVENYE